MSMKYTEDHEWVRIEADGSGTVGITEYAQEQLGDLVFVELPDLDDISQGDEAAVVESVKAAGEVKSPVSGLITAVNEDLNDEPSKVNAEPIGDGWIFKLKLSDESELAGLMDEAAYQEYVESLG